jgi:hypothetical protein
MMLLLWKVSVSKTFVPPCRKHPLTKPDLLEISGMEQTSLRI